MLEMDVSTSRCVRLKDFLFRTEKLARRHAVYLFPPLDGRQRLFFMKGLKTFKEKNKVR